MFRIIIMGDVENIEDGVLIERFRARDEEAFNALYAKYRLPLFGYIHKMLPNTCNATIDDYFQQVWMKVIPSLDKYNDKERFLAWLCRIGHNLLIDHFRKSSVRGYHVELNDEIDVLDSGSRDFQDFDEEARQQALEIAISGLAPEVREVLELRTEGIPFKEISERLDINLNTALGRMHQAVQKLKIAMRDFL